MPVPGFIVAARAGGIAIGGLGAALDAPSRLVSLAEAEGAGVLLLGRLHYTGEPARSPASIALARYRTGGAAALEALEGEFALVIWDLAGRLVLGLRDPLGCYPLYWTGEGATFAVATSLRPLAPLAGASEIDPAYLADCLAKPVLAMPELAGDGTPYAGIRRLGPGTVLTADLGGGRVATRRHWSWRERLIDPGTDRTGEIAAQARAALDLAVDERLGKVTGAHLSGGMDSTAVALIARDHLAKRGGGPLHTQSVVYESLTHLKGEAPFVEAALGDRRGLVPTMLAGDDLLAYDGFSDGPRLDEPFTGVLAAAQDTALLEAAAAAGCDTVLTGEGGDDVLDVAPLHIARMMRGGRPLAAWREASRTARARNVDPWPLFRHLALGPLLPPSLSAGWRALLAGGHVGWTRQGEGTIAPWITRNFARRHDLRGRMLAQIRGLSGGDPDPAVAAMLGAIRTRAGDTRRMALAAPRGIALSHPLLDARLLRLGLGIRLRYRQDPALAKPILAEATRGLLPEVIRERRAKGHFNEVYFKGLARNRGVIEEVIRRAPTDDPGMIDKTVLIDCLRKTALGAQVTGHGMMRLDQTLSLLHWLDRARTAPVAAPILGERHFAWSRQP